MAHPITFTVTTDRSSSRAGFAAGLPIADQKSLHRAGKPMAERIRGELQRTFSGGMPGSRVTLDSNRGSGGDRGLAMG